MKEVVITFGLILAVIVYSTTGNMLLALLFGLVIGPILQVVFKAVFPNIGPSPQFYAISKRAAGDNERMRLRVLFLLPKDFARGGTIYFDTILRKAVSELCEKKKGFLSRYSYVKPGRIDVYTVNVKDQKELKRTYKWLWRCSKEP